MGNLKDELSVKENWEKRAMEIGCPVDVAGSMFRWWMDGVPTGDFVRAVLENNLIEAFCRADDTNKLRMKEIVGFMYNYVPIDCYGSRETVKKWAEKKQAEWLAQKGAMVNEDD